jgi:nicotinate-nucleotide adenylyltransferase
VRKLGVFGGTFDPPHLAHLILAAEAQSQLGLDKVLWVLTPNPPHKLGARISPLDVRLRMLQAALADDPNFELSRVDIDRPAPHFAVDTLHRLADQFAPAELVYLMGGDSLRDLADWHQPQAFVQACDGIAVLLRPGPGPDLALLEAKLPGLTPKLDFIRAPMMEISSSLIRRRVRDGRPVRYFLPPPVFRILESEHLYRNQI